MKLILKSCKFRKFAPIEREHPIFELVHEDDGTVLLDVGATDTGVLEVAIHHGAVNRLFQFDELMLLLQEGQELVKKDLEEDL